MRFLALWNPFVFVGYDIASKQQIKETIRELYSSKPHITATIGFSFAGLSAAMSGAAWTGAVATLIVLSCLMFRIWMEHHFHARSPEEVGGKWVRLFVFGSLLSGFGWGLSGALLLYGTSAETQAITMGIACAILQGAAGRAYMTPGTALINISLVIGQMSIGAFAEGNYIYVPAFLLYFTFLASFIRQMVDNRLRQLNAEQTAERLFREITEKNELLRIANERLATKAYEDPLTGLANRRKFDLALAESLAVAGDTRSTISLMMIDVDHFKAFNDTYGHQSGDECLQLIARAISSSLAGRDSLVARYGGEEFVVIVKGEAPDMAIAIAERICLAVRLTSLDALPNAPPRQTISIGLASSGAGIPKTREAMLAAADAALYEAKKGGRNRVCVHRGPCRQHEQAGQGPALRRGKTGLNHTTIAAALARPAPPLATCRDAPVPSRQV
jgi:diguanylate cyclase (GGDEF)-like protein